MSTLNTFALSALPKTLLNRAGQLDRTFAAIGVAQVYFAGSVSSLTENIALDAQGRILVAAKVGIAAGSRFGLARMLADGSADLAFGEQGSVIDTFAPGFEATAGKVQVLPDGRILLAGLHYENAHRTLPALALFDAQGKPDLSFGDNGRQVVRLPGDLSMGSRDAWLPPGVPGAEACDFVVQNDGHILLIANHHFELADHAGMLIRLKPDGSLDETFNGRGFVMIRHLLLNTWLSSLLLQRMGGLWWPAPSTFRKRVCWHATYPTAASTSVLPWTDSWRSRLTAKALRSVRSLSPPTRCTVSAAVATRFVAWPTAYTPMVDRTCTTTAGNHNCWKSAPAAANGAPPSAWRTAASSRSVQPLVESKQIL